jgi:hypothetical protein
MTPPQHPSDWASLKNRAKAISEKYHYGSPQSEDALPTIERPQLATQLRKFCASESRIFVILGEAGIGKTTFITSFVQSNHTNNEVCAFALPANALRPDQPWLDQLLLGELGLDHDIVYVHEEDANIPLTEARFGSRSRRILVILDAINEARNGRVLLQQLVDFCRRTPYSSIKFVLASRPEAWRLMSQGLASSARLFYRPIPFATSQGETGSHVHLLSRLTKEEASTLYNSYKELFHLTTQFEAISPDVVRLMSLPLMMRLVCETSENEDIPLKASKFTIVVRFFEHLVHKAAISADDILFLRSNLVPTMVSHGVYTNTYGLVSHGLNEGTTPSDLLARVSVESAPMSSAANDERRVTRLAEAGILSMDPATGLTTTIRFRHELFFDVLVGERVSMLIRDFTGERFEEVVRWIERTTAYPFLWGAVLFAIVQDMHARKNVEELIDHLCSSIVPRQQQMMISVFEEYGRDDNGKAKQQLLRLLRNSAPSRQLGFFARDTIEKRTARRIAYVAAGKIGAVDLLLESVHERDSSIRISGIRNMFYLWQIDQLTAYAGVSSLNRVITNAKLFPVRELEWSLGFTFLVVFELSLRKRSNELPELRALWKPVIEHFLRVKVGDPSSRRIRRRVLLELIGSVVYRLVFVILDQIPQGRFFNSRDLSAFFRMERSAKDLYLGLIRYFDIREYPSNAEVSTDFVKAANTSNVLFQIVAAMALTSRFALDRNGELAGVIAFSEAAKSSPTPNTHVSSVPNIPMVVLDRDCNDDEVFQLFVTSLEDYVTYHTSHPEVRGVRHISPGGIYAAYLAHYAIYCFDRVNETRPSLLTERAVAATLRRDREFFDGFFSEMRICAFDLNRPDVALWCLRPIVDDLTFPFPELLVRFLARLYLHFPIDTYYFAIENLSPVMFDELRSLEVDETIGELIGIRIWYLVRDDVIGGEPEIRSLFQSILASAGSSRDLRQWVFHVIREITNLTYGESLV